MVNSSDSSKGPIVSWCFLWAEQYHIALQPVRWVLRYGFHFLRGCSDVLVGALCATGTKKRWRGSEPVSTACRTSILLRSVSTAEFFFSRFPSAPPLDCWCRHAIMQALSEAFWIFARVFDDEFQLLAFVEADSLDHVSKWSLPRVEILWSVVQFLNFVLDRFPSCHELGIGGDYVWVWAGRAKHLRVEIYVCRDSCFTAVGLDARCGCRFRSSDRGVSNRHSGNRYLTSLP